MFGNIYIAQLPKYTMVEDVISIDYETLEEMNYRVTELEEGNWGVVEKRTTQLINVFETKSEAEKACRFYNLGGGFDGMTPAFMLTEVNFQNPEDFDKPQLL